MSNDLKNILSNLNPGIEQEKLLQYLNDQLNAAQSHELEKHLNDDPFLNDAVEGLQMVKSKNNIPITLQQLNEGLKQQIKKSKRKRVKTLNIQQPWIYYTIILLLLLCVIGYLVIKKMG
jgi:hypothetical protein